MKDLLTKLEEIERRANSRDKYDMPPTDHDMVRSMAREILHLRAQRVPWRSPSECPEAGRRFFAIWRYTHPRIGGASWFTGDEECLPIPERSFGLTIEQLWNDYKQFTDNTAVVIAWMYQDDFAATLPPMECDECNGRGYWEHGLAGTRMECEACHGSGDAKHPASQGYFSECQIDAAERYMESNQ